MKKLFLSITVAAAALFAGCQKNEIAGGDNTANGGSTFELVAEIAQTKTTLDAEYNVAWEEDDVIYVVTTDETWGKPYSNDNPGDETIADFTYSDGKFTTEQTGLEEGKEYTFNAMYTTQSQRSYHRGASTTHKLSSTQSQDCSDPTAHLKENDALVGTFTATMPMEGPAQVTMSHLYTMMKVDVVNNTGAALDVTKFEMTAAGADLAGVFYVDFENLKIKDTKSGASETIAVNVKNGTVVADGKLSVYFVMAPLSAYAGDVTFKVTDAAGNTYTQTANKSALSFEAGEYNTTSYTIEKVDEVAPHVTWDLSKADYDSSSETEVKWVSDNVAMSLAKNTSSTAANNVLGGTGNYTHTRFYKGQSLSFIPKNGYMMTKIEIVATDQTYAGYYSSDVAWDNGSCSVSGKNVTVVPEDGHKNVIANINKATRATSITVYYEYDESYVAATLQSLEISGYTTEFVVDDAFVYGGTVTAIYSDGSSANVTASAQFTGYDMSKTGSQTVTVSYSENNVTKTASYQIVVNEKPSAPSSLEKVTIAEFLEKEVNNDTWYELTGEIVSIASDYYGNFTIKDDTGEVYIYGMTNGWVGSNDKSFKNIGLKVGDIVTLGTLRGEFSGTAQGGGKEVPAYYISHVTGGDDVDTDNNVVTYNFASYPAGTQYAEGEEHKLDDDLTLIINKAHLNTQVRLYDKSNAVIKSSSKLISKVKVNAGNKAATLVVSGSADGVNWTEVKKISTTTAYTEYDVDFTPAYKYVKFYADGAQIRLKEITVTYQEN